MNLAIRPVASEPRPKIPSSGSGDAVWGRLLPDCALPVSVLVAPAAAFWSAGFWF